MAALWIWNDNREGVNKNVPLLMTDENPEEREKPRSDTGNSEPD